MCSTDDKKSFVVIAAALGGLFLVIIVVIGFIYYKVKSNNTRTKIIPDQQERKRSFYLEQSTGSQIWVTTDKSISDLQLEIDDSRGETPFEMFKKQLPPRSHYNHNL